MNNQESIKEAILHYMEGWFEGDAARMSKALHTKLAKRHYDNGVINELDCNTMVSLTKDKFGLDPNFDSSKVEVIILNVYENIATAMIATKYIDYLHLVKIDDQWKIINVLWDFAR